MRLYFFRHAESIWNREGKLNGRSDIQLTCEGLRDVNAVKNNFNTPCFERVYCSPLMRTVDTAKILGSCSEEEIIKSSLLIERDFGIYEGETIENINLDLLEAVSESHLNIYLRVAKFLKKIQTEDAENILIVSHNTIMRHAMVYMFKIDYKLIDFSNLGFFVAEYVNDKWLLLDTSESNLLKFCLESKCK